MRSSTVEEQVFDRHIIEAIRQQMKKLKEDSEQEVIMQISNLLNPNDIHSSWKPIIETFIKDFLIKGKQDIHPANALFNNLYAGYNPNSAVKVTVYPKEEDVYKAYRLGIQQIKVVILGQDPYHGGQAHGLAFSSTKTCPPSLRVIFNEIKRDIGIDRYLGKLANPTNLLDWHSQGIMLLNSCLTVEKGKAGSHIGLGWEKLTTATLRALIIDSNPKVFVTWGKKAQAAFDEASKGFLTESFFRANKHLNLRSPHPAADTYPGYKRDTFAGCGHFSKINTFMKAHYGHFIQWGLV